MKREIKISQGFVINSFYLLLITFFFSCAPAKYIPKDQYLLNKNKILIDDHNINKAEIQNYLLQKPNKKWIFGMRLNLYFYNLSNVIFKKWFGKIGEEPVIFDPYLTKRSKDQLKKYLENKGFYYSEISDSVSFRKQNTNRRNAVVTYTITPNQPYYVRNIFYSFEDTSLVSSVLSDSVNSLLKNGMLFDKEILEKERIRIENLLKNKGFYHFSKEYIFYNAKPVQDSLYLDLTMGIKEFVEGEADRKTKIKNHPRYKINEVSVFPDINPLNIDTGIPKDTTIYDGLKFIQTGELKIKPTTIANYNYLIPGNLYSSNNVDKTYQNLTLMGIYKFVNIQFSEPEYNTDTLGYLPIDAKIELTRNKVHSYLFEPELTNSTSDIGVRSSLSYQNLNLFRGSEIFNIKISGGFEAFRKTDSIYTNTIEYGAEAKIELPRFWLPFKSEQFVKKYGPKTLLSLAVNHRTDRRYVRTYANAAFGYTWKGNRHLRHSVYPIELNFVQMDEEKSSKEFIDLLDVITQKYSYSDHLVSISRYSIEYNNQQIGKVRDFMFFRMNIESAGNFLMATSKIGKRPKYEDRYLFFNTPFSQFLKSDYDLRFFNVLDAKNTLAYRIFFGLGYPYGNSNSMPYEKKYSTGGAYSMRAWKSYTLGPGSFVDSAQSSFARYENAGDIKLEMNFEYRFKLFWKVEGALFADAGNIWNMKNDSLSVETQFRWNSFYKEIAIGVGFGTRFDFSFFLFRIDLGMKIRDPELPLSERWIPFNHKMDKYDFPIQFGIGYPF